MSPRSRRLGLALGAFGFLAAVAAFQRAPAPPQHTFRIVFGLRDREPTDWGGRVAVSGGEVARLEGWHFEGKDSVEGLRWTCSTHNGIAPGARFPLARPGVKPPAPPREPWPNGIYLTVRGASPTVTLTVRGKEVTFKAAELALGEPRTFLGGQVRVERSPATSVLRPAAPRKAERPVQDDYPAFWVRYKTGKQYLAWVAYQAGKDRVLLAVRDGPDGAWSEPVEVAGPGDHFRVALAGTHEDVLWIVWGSQRGGDWDLYARPYQAGKLGKEVRLTRARGPDLWHVMTTDRRGRAWVVWQGFRDGQSDIFARCADSGGWHETVRVSTSKANDWNPAIAADAVEDRVWVAWDTYEGGSYSVRVRSLSGGPRPTPGEVLRPERTPLFQAHPSLACDREGRLWLAWDQSGANWGKDAGFLYPRSGGTRLYQGRQVRVACLDKGKWLEPESDFTRSLPPELHGNNELPRLQVGGEGRVWLAFRHRTVRHPRVDGWAIQGRWDVYATAWLGGRWTTPVELPHGGGRNDMRVDSQRDRAGNVYFAHASDNRRWVPPNMAPRNLSVAVSRLSGAPRPSAMKLRALRTPDVKASPVHPDEVGQVARARGYAIKQGGKTYHIYRGDLHRHTDISLDGIGDGSLMDLHRYALDSAALDFITVTDHNMGHDREYPWWRTQKANDLYTVPGAFISMYGYERSVPYPKGHRNVVWAERGHRTLPLPRPGIRKSMAEDTRRLYAYLRKTDGICTPHTSASDQGTDWSEHDDKLEPVVELFQGYHTAYEAPDAPRSIGPKTEMVHGKFQPAGFVARALAKGYRLGFQASSDHVSTHVSYACVLAEDFSRKGLIDALRRRHCYAATDNIVLDVRLGRLGIMGDEVRTDRPALEVVVLGTGPLARVEVLRDGKVVHTHRPVKGGDEARFRWDDPAPPRGEAPTYYYVRVTQTDGQMAWSSPVWVRK